MLLQHDLTYLHQMFCDLAQDLEEDKIQTICDVGAQLATLEQRTYQAMIKVVHFFPRMHALTCLH